ncbi:hypothetical protein Tco_0832012, partial [Tanacetum coccineum]
ENDASWPHDNVVSNMTENEDFNMISQIVVVNNEMSSGFETNDEDSEDDDGTGDDHDISVDSEICETPYVDGQDIDSNKHVPFCFTSLEGIEKSNIVTG